MTSLMSTQILSFEETTDTDLPAFEIQSEPGIPPDYSIELYRLYLCCTEEANIVLEGQSAILQKGELLTLSPGEIVAFEPDTMMRSLSFHHNFFCVRVMRDEIYCDGVVFNRLTGLPIVSFPERELQLLNNRLLELDMVVKEKGPFAFDRAINVLRSLLLHAADFKTRSINSSKTGKIQKAQLSPLVLAFQQLVEEHFAEHKDANFYSDVLKVSTVTLNRRVKSELDLSIKQAVNERLAIEARVALRSGRRSVKDVALDLGFVDPLYFSRFFSKQFGSPPSKYFQDVRGNRDQS